MKRQETGSAETHHGVLLAEVIQRPADDIAEVVDVLGRALGAAVVGLQIGHRDAVDGEFRQLLGKCSTVQREYCDRQFDHETHVILLLVRRVSFFLVSKTQKEAPAAHRIGRIWRRRKSARTAQGET